MVIESGKRLSELEEGSVIPARVYGIGENRSQQFTPKQIVDAGRPVATNSEALVGSRDDVAMTPLKTRTAISAQVASEFAPIVEQVEQAAAQATEAAGQVAQLEGDIELANVKATVYPNRAAAEAAAPPAGVDFIHESGLLRVRSPFGDLQTANGGLFAPLAGALGYSYVVRVPSQYPTVQASLDGTFGLKLGPNSTITILSEAGHRLTHGWAIRGGDWSHYRIASEDAVVRTVETGFQPVDSSAVPESFAAIMYYNDCAAPRLDCHIRGWGTLEYDGMICFENVSVAVGVGCGVTNTRMNCEVRQGGEISANGTIWSDAQRACIRLTNGVQYSIAGSTISNGWQAGASQGGTSSDANVHISRGSSGQAQSLIIPVSAYRAVTVRRGYASLIGMQVGVVGQAGGVSTTTAIELLDGGMVSIGGATVGSNPIAENNINIGVINQVTSRGIAFGDAQFGGPITRGGNEFSGWQKLPNGIAEAWGYATINDHAVTTAEGAIFRSGSAAIVSFSPDAGFIDTPVINVSVRNPSGSVSVWTRTVTPDLTSFSATFLAASSTTVSSLRVMYRAIGRWR